MRRLSIVLLATLLAGGSAAATVDQGPDRQRVIVMLTEDAPGARDIGHAMAADHGGRLLYGFEHAINGFVADIPAGRMAALARHPHVAAVEPDVEVSIAQTTEQVIPTGWDRIEADLGPEGTTTDVDIAILDTGIAQHPDLNLRYVIDCQPAYFYPDFGGCTGTDYFDKNGHGTHVAGTAAARDNNVGIVGVAPGARLWSVKVLNDAGSGYLGWLIAGVDIVTQYSGSIDVANMSLSGQFSSGIFETALKNSVAQGVLWAVAAGNGATDATPYSPAGHPDVLTVSALADGDGAPGGLGTTDCRPGETDDTLASFSNYGPQVDIAAPGVCITSTHLNDGYATYSGTSMASPHVAGALARWIAVTGTNPTNATEAHAAYAALLSDAIAQTDLCGFGGDDDGYEEGLLFVNGSAFGGDGTCGGAPPPPPPPPPADTPPTAAWVTPADASTVSGTAPIAIDATDTEDALGTLTVEWRVDGGAWQIASDADADGTYEASWDTTASSNGPATLEARSTDSANNTTTDTISVTVDNPVPNQPPTAAFTATCDGMTCSFDASTSTDDAGIVSYTWDFGDGNTGTGVTADHTYAAPGTYTVELTVQDAESLTDSTSTAVSPAEPVATMILFDLTASYRGKKQNQATATAVITESGGTTPIAGATVEGIWIGTGGWLMPATGVTDSSGEVKFNSGKLPANAGTIEFCVSDVIHPDYEYDPLSGVLICAIPPA